MHTTETSILGREKYLKINDLEEKFQIFKVD